MIKASISDVRMQSGTAVQLSIAKYRGYTGGYLDTATNKLYFNAKAQTLFAHDLIQDKPVLLARETQTVDTLPISIQTQVSSFTQTTRRGYVQSATTDRVLTVTGKYVSADDLHMRRVVAAIRIQSFFRVIMALKRANTLRSARDMDSAYKQSLAKARQRVRVHLETNQPHALLSPLQWKSIMNSLDQSLDKQSVDSDGPDTIEKALNIVSKPKEWKSKSGEHLFQLDNPDMKRARDLQALLQALHAAPNVAVDIKKRLKILQNIKYTAAEFPCALTEEISYLVQREIDWLGRGRKQHSLLGLRQRLYHLFLQFVKNSEYNPAITRIHGGHTEAEMTLKQCTSCLSHLPVSLFSGSKCKKCIESFYEASNRVTDASLKQMQSMIRIEERLKKSHLKAMFGISSQSNSETSLDSVSIEKLRQLVDGIWKSKSVVPSDVKHSADNLILTRWNFAKVLAVDNCVLMTCEQASTHDKQMLASLADVQGVIDQNDLVETLENALAAQYSDEIRLEVRMKHDNARNMKH
eukprot:Partr_v1_DN28645_c0_g1_i1_m49529 putative IQ motif and ubiquitin domain containing